MLQQLGRVDAGEVGLRHLLAADGQVPVRPDLGGRLDAGRHQHRRPVDGVEPQDVLADRVDVRGPQLVEPVGIVDVAGRGDVVRQRVEPDVGDVGCVPRQRHAPVERRAADREVLQTAADQRQHLVATRRRARPRRGAPRSAPGADPRRRTAGRSSCPRGAPRPVARGSGTARPGAGRPRRSRPRTARSTAPRNAPGRCRRGRCRRRPAGSWSRPRRGGARSCGCSRRRRCPGSPTRSATWARARRPIPSG